MPQREQGTVGAAARAHAARPVSSRPRLTRLSKRAGQHESLADDGTRAQARRTIAVSSRQRVPVRRGRHRPGHQAGPEPRQISSVSIPSCPRLRLILKNKSKSSSLSFEDVDYVVEMLSRIGLALALLANVAPRVAVLSYGIGWSPESEKTGKSLVPNHALPTSRR